MLPAYKFEEIVRDEWQALLDKDDRTSPAEYPDMVLVTREELRQITMRIWEESQL